MHTAVTYIAPWPFYLLNIINISLFWLLIKGQRTKAFWLAAAFSYLTELFSAEKFGVHIAAVVLSVIIVAWLLQTVFTNLSWYTIFIIGIVGAFIYRFLFVLLVFVSQMFKNVQITSAYFVSSVLVEIAMNAAGLLVIYFSSRLFNRRSGPKYI